MRAFVVGLAIVVAAISASANPDLSAVGPGRSPAYIYVDELRDVAGARLKSPRQLQSGRPGGSPIVLREGLRYLWAVEMDGTLRVAPERISGKGVEESGHPLLTGGRPARLAGVMVMRKGVLVVDSDSGRYAYMDSTLSPARLRAAARWIEKVGVVSTARSRPIIKTSYVPSIYSSEAKGSLDRQDRRRADFAARTGGYLLLPARGQAHAAYPKSVGSSPQRLQWARKARRRLGSGLRHRARR